MEVGMGVILIFAVCFTLALTIPLLGCASNEAVAQQEPTRYEVAFDQKYGQMSVCTVTDTETGQQWLAVMTSTGDIDIEPIGGESND